MINHAYLVREPPEDNLSGAIRQLNGVYTQRFNRPHDRVGGISERWMTTERNYVPEPDPHR